jgi:DNA-damage-inducible protein J
MNSTVINIKTDVKVKKEAKKVAADLGLSLSGAINGFLRQLIRDKKIIFTLNEGEPSEYLKSAIKRSEDDIKNGRVYSFKNNREAIDFLADK